MKLDRIHVQGFKSFKDRTTIVFHNGITGIVGPNGCGKSNIVDALFWVMGEQSAKHLRGDKMSDLIFSGTTKYHSAAFAEVTLVLQNTNLKHIHINNKVLQPSEIELTRKLYRDGETEYRINGIPARLKDIQEVFMDTGAGAKSYSIIAQGEIDRLVKAKPEDRRTMIDEVAGITKFKLRRKESLKKIELTQGNLSRIQDLKKEIHKYLQSLSEQAAKATKARNLQDKINKTEMNYLFNKEFDYLEKLATAQEKLFEAQTDLSQLTAQYQEVDIKLQQLKNEKTEKIDAVDKIQEEYNEQSRELVKLEEQSKALKNFIEQAENQKEQLEQDLTDLRNDWDSRNKVLEEVKKHIEELENLDVDAIDESGWQERIDVLEENHQLAQEEWNQLSGEKQSISQQEQKLNQQKEINQHKLDDIYKQLQETTEEVDQLENTYSLFNEESELKREALKEQEQQLQTIEQELLDAEEKLKKETPKLEELKQTVMSDKADANRLKNQIHSFQKILDQKTKVKNDFKFESDWGATAFNDLFDVNDKRWAASVDLYVKHFQHTFVLTAGAGENLQADWKTWYESETNVMIGSVADAAKIQAKQASIKSILAKYTNSAALGFADLVTFRNAAHASQLAGQFAAFIYLKDINANDFWSLPWEQIKGELSEAQLGEIHIACESVPVGMSLNDTVMTLLAYGQKSQEDGILVLRKQLQDWNEELGQIETRMIANEAELATFNAKLNELKAKKQQGEQTKFTLIKSLSGHSAEIQAKQSAHQNAMARLDILKRKKSECSSARLNYLELDETIEIDLEELQDKMNDVEARLSESKTSLDQALQKLNAVKQEYQALQAKGQGKELQLARLRSQEGDVAGQIQKIEERISRNKQIMVQSAELLSSKEIELETALASLKEKQGSHFEFKAYLQEQKENLAKHLLEIEEQEKSFKHYVQKKQQFERIIDEQNGKIPGWKEDELLLARDWAERFKFDVRNLVQHFWTEGKFPEDLSAIETERRQEDKVWEILYPEFDWARKTNSQIKDLQDRLRRYNNDLKDLGPINWHAIEEYDRQKLRHDFLEAQEMELTKSIEDLMFAIQQIDEKSRLRFQAAFDSINDKFSKVFPIIFGGGHARLQLTTKVEDPECGVEIVAQPPGKKMQSINLMSGGEKAMTAVSLIFSIFLVKPSPFCLLDEVDAPLDDANVGRFNELLREMSNESQFILITHNKKTMELNDTLYGITMQEPGVSQAVSVQLQ
jgi:chromosome segregation protein